MPTVSLLPFLYKSGVLSNYLAVFDPRRVFQVLYRDILRGLSESRIMAFDESSDVILVSGFINLVEARFVEYFGQSVQRGGKASAEIHRENLERFQDRWLSIRSDSTCFPCLRRRP